MKEVIDEIYDSGDMPVHFSRPTFVALPEKPGANKCDFTVNSLLSHISKLVIQILIVECEVELDQK